ncbi:acyltransferase [Romboutsia sedimentorum]|uniref:Acyltransferase n=1 Tax=Romboutsia sedimentorum TaxID=1368474 RepID=A0ABT7E5P9_9FIRM|nr:acyltransferase [Romboutsia sedimentorum]MDK2562254.1 acyltransferase [Romboutsia sedimentorum]
MKSSNKLSIYLNFIFRNIPIHIVFLITSLLPNHLYTNLIRGFLIKPFIGSGGKHLQIAPRVTINNPENLYVGSNCYISHNVYINAKGKIVLDDNVIIGPMSVLATTNHIFENGIVKNKGISKPIYIKKGTWCASHVVITSGITIGEGSLVAAGSVVTKNVETKSVVGGIPAKFISKNDK